MAVLRWKQPKFVVEQYRNIWAHSMASRAGSADLPLHGGRVPPWLAERMAKLGAVISQAIVHHYGRDELLSRLSQPFLP